ncbi:MAG: DcaP family trimeric outer membrane transporter [Betaproteobacteria bacterium]
MFQPKKIALAVGFACIAAGPVLAADDISELKAQMKALAAQNAALTAKLDDMQKQLKTLDSNVGAVPKTFKVVTAGDEDGTFKLPGSDTSVGIYGYARLDAYVDLKGRQAGDWAADIGSQPLNGIGDTRKGKTNLTARQSRFGIKTITPTEMGTLRTMIEGDFVQNRAGGFTDADYTAMVSSGYQLRLRHAYGEIDGDWGKLLGGQTWSTFMSDALPETIDFNGHGSAAFMRQAQIRYTAKLGVAGDLAFAFENPYGTADGLNPAQTIDNIDKRPDFIMNWKKSFERGFVTAQFLNSEYRIDNGAGIKTSKQGWGFGLGGAWKVTDNDNLMLQVTVGEGIGRYIPTTSYHIAVIDANNKIQLYRSSSWVAGWAHNWSETVRSNLAYGQTLIQDNYLNNLATVGLDSRRMSEGFANVIWGIAKNTELGLEYSWGTRKTYADQGNGGIVYTGSRSRIQGSLQYNF